MLKVYLEGSAVCSISLLCSAWAFGSVSRSSALLQSAADSRITKKINSLFGRISVATKNEKSILRMNYKQFKDREVIILSQLMIFIDGGKLSINKFVVELACLSRFRNKSKIWKTDF